jgi:hypothetical protein
MESAAMQGENRQQHGHKQNKEILHDDNNALEAVICQSVLEVTA